MSLEEELINDAEKFDRKMSDTRLAMLKKTYAYFKDTGMNDEEIKKVMNLTSFELNKVNK